MEYRRLRNLPLHSPPHWAMGFSAQYLITASCFEHAPIIGQSPERLTECEAQILAACQQHASNVYAWCVFPIITIFFWDPGASRPYAGSLDAFMGDLLSSGMAKTDREGARFGFAVLIVRSDQSVIFGQR
jgi:hypothetical protein